MNQRLIELFLYFQVFNFLIFLVEFNFFNKILSNSTLLQKTKIYIFFSIPFLVIISLIFNPFN
jgi:hypothetical protein